MFDNLSDKLRRVFKNPRVVRGGPLEGNVNFNKSGLLDRRFLKHLIALLLIPLAASPVFPAQCSYQTIAGSPVTFQGDGVPVAQSLFNAPQSIVAGSDGSIYIADTDNNRVRRITADGIIRTIAGTGRPSFSGDGGPATQATLNQPAGLALATDGTLYISDTSNNRVRTVDLNGNILTVAGEGHSRFGGDGGPAIAASLNLPTGLAIDGSGNLFILDSMNSRVRRVGKDGVIQTVAGSLGPDDYNNSPPCCQPAPPAAPGASVPLYLPQWVKAGVHGEIYISDDLALRQLDTSGTLSTVVFYLGSNEQPITSATPIANLQLNSAIPVPLPDGSLALITALQIVRVVNGIASPLNSSYSGPLLDTFSGRLLDAFGDPSTGGFVALNSGPAIQRITLGGVSSSVYSYAPQTDPSKVQSPLDLTLLESPGLAVGPDQTIYFGQVVAGSSGGKVLALSPGGQLTTAATFPAVPLSLAVDSKGNLYAALTGYTQVFRITPGSAPQAAYKGSGLVTSIRFDGQDRLYAFQSNPLAPLIRFNADNSITTLVGDLDAGLPSIFGAPGFQQEPMAVAADGTVYLAFTEQFSNTLSQIMKVSPGSTGFPAIVPMERRVFPGALALSASGDLYLTGGGPIYKLLADGTLVTVRGGDGYGFWGEQGYNSEPELNGSSGSDFAIDGQGNLVVIDRSSQSVKRIALGSCSPAPSPAISAVVQSAGFPFQALKLAAGQLFSIYGERLGPATGVVTQFDASGHLPNLVSGTQVTVNGIPAPLLYVGASQINAIVPFDLAGQEPARIAVTNVGQTSDIFPDLIGNYGPALFNYPVGPSLTTPDYYVWMLNVDGTVNSATNPAKLGTAVTIYATGTGSTNPAGDDGAQAGVQLKTPVWPVTIQVEQQTATLLYVGTEPTEVEGVTQINLVLPDSLPGRGGSSAFIRIEMGRGVPAPNSRDLLFYFAP